MMKKIAILFVLIIVAFIFFGYGAGYDLGISRWVYENGGWYKRFDFLNILREIYYNGSFILLILFGVMWFFAWREKTRIPAFVYGFFVTLSLLGPIVLVNVILKSHWGRARPYMIEEFGGDKVFTAAQIFPVDQCMQNCSFVSGEAAASATMMFMFLAMFGHSLLSRIFIIGIFAPMAIMRVLFGMHFFSDIVFAYLFIWFLALVLLQICKKTPADLKVDISEFLSDLRLLLFGADRAIRDWFHKKLP